MSAVQALSVALAEFAQECGMPVVPQLGADDSVQLRFNDGAVAGIAARANTVLVHVAEPVGPDPTARLAAARVAQPQADALHDATALAPRLRDAADGPWLVLAAGMLAGDCRGPQLVALLTTLRRWLIGSR